MRFGFRLLTLSCSLGVCFIALTPVAVAQMYDGIYTSPVPNLPLTAVVDLDQTRIKPDGTRIPLKAVETIARDSHGRMYRDAWRLMPGASKPSLLTIVLYDPKSKTYTIIDPMFKTFWTGPLDQKPAIMGAGFFYDPHDDGSAPSQLARGKDVGVETMEGVPVHHISETDDVSDDLGKHLITREYWYSDDLHMSLMTQHIDSRAVLQKITVTQISRKEPDASIYAIPTGYRRVNTLFQLHTPPQ